ncbi:MAG: hypothetical protein O6931_07825 [Gammaproteobacteria bacterium]|nr:hypothetical protein [Gammaproteobacteria bacterium]
MRKLTLILFTLGLLTAAPAVFAIGTSAGTDITNSAQVDYVVAGTPVSQNSNILVVTVAEILDVNVLLQSPIVPVTPGDASRSLLFTVTNTGNGTDDFVLSIDSALTGDNFDPNPSLPSSIFFDTDGSGDLSAGDTPYNAGVNDPQLAADASINVLLVNDIPLGLVDGNLGFSELTATTAFGVGNSGDVLGGQGDSGTDAMYGNSGGDDADTGTYIVSNVSLSIVKSASVSDPFGGTQPVPGAQITYQIVVTASGSGTAISASFSDPIPPFTTYQAGSLTLNGGPLTDAPDADVGAFVGGAVTVSLGDLDQADGPQTIAFTVVIN